ncbi:MAG: penicillin-binding transpeptidase domain-containing protein [Bryobacterales bacterium]|nr:penicillin-binding transpeptidase domain-containing protein [Bryobacterales bacterium]
MPRRGAAESWDRYAGTLMPVAEREFRTLRGGLALARIPGMELIFASHPARCATTLWKPGSTVKPFLLRHLIDRGLLRADEAYPCNGGPLPFAGRRLDCSHARQGAPLDPSTALALSCNLCFLHWAQRLAKDPGGIAAFAETLRRAGFAARQPFGRECAAAQVGNPGSKEAMMLQSLGEADALTTPLALLAAYCGLLKTMSDGSGSAPMDVLRRGMQDCVRAGTGIEARVPGLDLGGKTGTATSADRRSLNGWMLSFWPAAAPRYAMVVFVERGRGGVEAAPIAAAAWKALRPLLLP